MTVLLPLQMAYSLVGETYHEAEGVLLFALFITHHAMHLSWWKNLLRGRYNAYRLSCGDGSFCGGGILRGKTVETA
ncbi:MAG: hypothetical protein IJT94_05015 [Oscillibacter sp.]|nr:hypothetical protein [Oscillibacter sp.]